MGNYHDPYYEIATQNPHLTLSLRPSQFLGSDYLDSPYHKVRSVKAVNGDSLLYTIQTPHGDMEVLGTEQTKTRIREIQATETLRKRSTVGTMFVAAWDRTTNLVETPYRLGKSLIQRADDVKTAEDVVLFAPKIIGDVSGGLIRGLGEFVVTGLRITRGAAGTQCSGTECLNKMGADIVSGANSLAGKHNAARLLHAEFRTDPETHNRDYRRQIDRVSYASAYTSTTIKLGAGQAGIDYVSPAFTGVGFYNNGEFIAQYEDAHRQRNREKQSLLSWGADPDSVERFYRNKAFTKAYRRRAFKALSAIPDENIATQLLHQAAKIDSRYLAERFLVTLEYMGNHAAEGAKLLLSDNGGRVYIRNDDGTLIDPIYADYLYWTPALEMRFNSLSQNGGRKAIHILGRMDEEVKRQASRFGIEVFEFNPKPLQSFPLKP